MQLEEKKLQWFGHIRGMDRTRMLRKASEFKFKTKRSV
jgi:hypothetical protein